MGEWELNMILPNITFVDYSENQEGHGLRKSSSDHKALFTKLIDALTEQHPHLKSWQIKAMAIEQFLLAAGIDVICIDTVNGKDYGTGIFHKETNEKIAFIKTNSMVVNILHDLYFKGVFDSSKVAEPA